MLINKNIFENIFQDVSELTEIKIITGYTSSRFVEYFVTRFLDINLKLFIGMSQQGILKKDHLKYQEIMKKYPNIEIYYQISGALTHIKLISLHSRNSVQTFIGSSNFSFDGLFKNNELMTLIEDSVDSLFEEQINRSIKVTHCEAEKVVLDNDISNEFTLIDSELPIEELCKWKKEIDSITCNFRIDKRFYKIQEFDLDRFENLFTKDSEGDNRPILKFPVGFRSDQFFKLREKLTIYYQDNSYDCELAGKFSSELRFLNNDLQDLVKDLMEQGELKFTKTNFLNSEYKSIKLIRLNETEYSLSFIKK